MDSEMVERVTQAMAARLVSLGVLRGPMERPRVLGSCRLAALDAIAAMREPTLAMRLAASREVLRAWNGKGDTITDASEPIYQAMIDAALTLPGETE